MNAPEQPSPAADANNLPPIDALHIGFIGAGRLGTALAWSLARQGLRVTCAASADSAHARALTDRIPGCAVLLAQEVADSCDLAFVTTPDGAIAEAAQAVRWRAGMGVVHCSGATEVEALASARREGAAIGGFHPMQTFGDPAAAVASLPGSTITIEAHQPLDAVLLALAARLSCVATSTPTVKRST